MDDYLTIAKVPASIYNPTAEDFYTNGVTLFTVDNYQNYKIAYYDESIALRVGFYQNGLGGDSNKHFVIMAGKSVSNIDIRLISPYMTVVARITSITRRSPYGRDCFFAEFEYTNERMGYKTNRFETLNDCLYALAFSETPSGDSGVVVTAVASPMYDPPSTSGVIVYATGRLLDPNAQGGTSNTGGGQGTFNETSDSIPIPVLPYLSAADCGMVTLFRPTKTQLDNLASYLWTNLTDFIENLNKLFMNPMDYLISLNILPCVPDVGEDRAIKIGSFTTTINMPPVLSQWYEFNCGSVQISEFWGSALDYAPFTKISLFLPFIGSVTLNTDEVMGKRIGVVYRIDLLSGQCVAMVTVNDSVYYQFTGECGVSIPMTGADWSRIYSAAIGVVGTAITGGIAAGAAGAAVGSATSALTGLRASEAMSAAGRTFTMLNNKSEGVRGIQEMRARMIEAADIASNAARQAASVPTQVGNAIRASRIANTVNNTVGQVINGKGHITHSGTISGSAGMLGVKVPYVLLEFPNQSLANNYKHFVGYPSNISGKLSDFSGYTECEQIVPVGFIGTDDELAELLEVLKGGVYL